MFIAGVDAQRSAQPLGQGVQLPGERHAAFGCDVQTLQRFEEQFQEELNGNVLRRRSEREKMFDDQRFVDVTRTSVEFEVGTEQRGGGGRVQIGQNLFCEDERERDEEREIDELTGEESAELFFGSAFGDQRRQSCREARLVRANFPRFDQFLLQHVSVQDHRATL